jgi:hypothetical protein
MTDRNIEPSKITKPIQLLAAWLAGLVLVNGSFLAAANALTTPAWASGILVVAAVLNVPLFLAALFLLQTKFRPEMQEDEFYSKYLHSRYSLETGTKELVISSQIEETRRAAIVPHKHTEGTQVMVNDMLSNYAEVRSALMSADIKINNIFGSTAVEPEVPPHLLLTLGREVDLGLLQSVIKALEGKIDYISLVPEGWEADAIYVGSYAYREKGFSKDVKWSHDLEQKLLSRRLTHQALTETLG